MKAFITVLRVLGTFILSVIIIPLMICTMTLYSVTHAVQPESLTKIITSVLFTDSGTSNTPDTSEDDYPHATGLACRIDNIDYSFSENPSDIDISDIPSEIDISDIPSDLDLTEIIKGIKVDEKNGVVYIGDTGKIDLASTGLADIPELADITVTEENIKNILSNEKIMEVVQDYVGNSLDSFISGEELPDVTSEQLENITNALLDGVEKEFNVEIPVEVKQNVTNEVSKNSSELSDVVRDVAPSVDEIKETYSEQLGMSSEDFDKILTAATTAVKMLFDSTLFYLMLGIVIFVAILILCINFKKLNGLLVVGILGILCGALFSAIGILSGIFSFDTDAAIVELIQNLSYIIKNTGFVTIGISVLLIVVKIVVGNIILGKIRRNKMLQDANM